MGINLDYIPFLDTCRELGALEGPFLALGSQEVHDPPQAMDDYAARHGYARFGREKTVAALLAERFGIADYQDVDMNEAAALQIDLGLPLAPELAGRYRTVLDGGTLEHIFHASQAFINIHELAAADGLIIHLAPMTWHNHGFVNFNPRLYDAIAQANGYSEVAEGFYFRARPRSDQRTGMLAKLFCGEREDYQPPVGLLLTRVAGEHQPAAAKVAEAMARPDQPASVLYLRAYQKTSDAEFKIPYDIQD